MVLLLVLSSRQQGPRFNDAENVDPYELGQREIGSDKTVASDAKNIVQECSGSNRRQSDESVMLKA